MKNRQKEQLISQLNMTPHPEGGYYSETYRSNITAKGRELYSSIYFLLETGNISHFHRIDADELWYFHGGDALVLHMIMEEGTYQSKKLGLDILNGEVPQYLVPKNTIFASTVEEDNEWSLVGCMVSPAFKFETFELFTQHELMEMYPEHEKLILKYALNEKE